MLYRNDELYKLTMQDRKDIRKKYPKFPLRLTFPESRIRKNPSKHNRLPDKPTSISFPFYGIVKSKTGTVQWRYAEHRIVGANGKVVFTPNSLVLRGTMTLQESDMELVFWLVNCCPVLEGGKNFNHRKPKCAIEDLVGSAERKVAKEAKLATVKALIYSPQVGLSEEKLRLVAKAYFITGVDELSYPQVKLAVEAEIQRNKVGGVSKFIDLVDAEQTITVKSNIQNAIDEKIITFMVAKKTWAWVTEEGRKNEPIATVGAGVNPNEALYDYYLGDRKFAEQLLAALKGEKVVPAE